MAKSKKSDSLKIVISADVKKALSELSKLERKLDSVEKRMKNISSGFIRISGKQLITAANKQSRSAERLS